ncbi:hypothetical protein RCO48_19105 [Peribacillus frigoritolerans]|nr:hypothetical protein [Peribacillus frigoritolerans]
MTKKAGAQKPDFKAAGIITISGVRGAVTLAGSFSIPYVLADGSPFPERSLIIFIAAGVILLTLIVASVFSANRGTVGKKRKWWISRLTKRKLLPSTHIKPLFG